MEVCGVQEKLDTFELIYGPSLINHWYTIDMKDMFNTLIEILNKVNLPFVKKHTSHSLSYEQPRDISPDIGT